MPTGGGAWSPLTGHPAPARPVQHAPPVGPCGSAQQGPPQGACCQGSKTQAEAPVAPCASQRGRCAGAPGGGRAPQLPAASWESGWDEQSVFAAPPTPPQPRGGSRPLTTLAHRPTLPWHRCPVRWTQASSLLHSWGWEHGELPVEAGRARKPPLPNPGRPLPTASASLERAARARAGAGEEPDRSSSQAMAELRAAWAQGCRPEPADSAGKAVGVASDSSRLGGRCGAQRAPSARADLGQAPIRGSSPERTCLRWDAEAVPTPLSARQGAGVRAGGSESRGLRQRGLRAVGGPALATLSPRFLDLVTVCN